MSEAENKTVQPKSSPILWLRRLFDLHLTYGADVKKDEDAEKTSARNTCGIISIVLTLIMVTFGFAKRNQCEAEPMIPIWIITLGVVWILWKVIEIARRRFKPTTPAPTTEVVDAETGETKSVAKPGQLSGFPTSIAFLYFLLKAFSWVWFGFGCYWVFSAYSDREHCDWWVFYAALVYLIFSIALTIFSCCVLCCVGCLLQFTLFSSG